MKNLIFPIVFLTLMITGCRKDEEINLQEDEIDLQENKTGVQRNCDFIDFKYYNGTQDSLGELSTDYILIGIDTVYNDNKIQDFIVTVNQLDTSYDYTIHTSERYKFKEIPLKFNSSKTCEEITQIISELERNTIIAYAHYTMQTDNCTNAIWEPMGAYV